MKGEQKKWSKDGIMRKQNEEMGKKQDEKMR